MPKESCIPQKTVINCWVRTLLETRQRGNVKSDVKVFLKFHLLWLSDNEGCRYVSLFPRAWILKVNGKTMHLENKLDTLFILNVFIEVYSSWTANKRCIFNLSSDLDLICHQHYKDSKLYLPALNALQGLGYCKGFQ